jgi:hypothetical protein
MYRDQEKPKPVFYSQRNKQQIQPISEEKDENFTFRFKISEKENPGQSDNNNLLITSQNNNQSNCVLQSEGNNQVPKENNNDVIIAHKTQINSKKQNANQKVSCWKKLLNLFSCTKTQKRINNSTQENKIITVSKFNNNQQSNHTL